MIFWFMVMTKSTRGVNVMKYFVETVPGRKSRVNHVVSVRPEMGREPGMKGLVHGHSAADYHGWDVSFYR